MSVAVETETETVDAINAGLYALAGYDPALVHCAELRERNAHRGEYDILRVSLDRFLAMYMEAQGRELAMANNMAPYETHRFIDETLKDNLATTTFFAVGATSDPLMLDVLTYAMYLGTLTSHGLAPWNRFATVMAECFYTKHPDAKKFG